MQLELLYEITMKESYSNKDLEELTELAKTLWEIDYLNKKIKRKPNVIGKTVPVKAIYRMVKQDMDLVLDFPFTQSSFTGVLGLAEGWNISVKDRKYLEKDTVLFADDKKTIIVLPENKKWWETTWFNLLSISLGIGGFLFGLVAWLNG